MSPSPSVIAAANTLADWARERRRTWTDVPLDPPMQPAMRVESAEASDVPLEWAGVASELESEPEAEIVFSERVEQIEEIGEPEPEHVAISLAARIQPGLTLCAASAARLLAWLESLVEPTAEWLIRGAALVSTMSVVMIIGINRGELFTKWDRVAAMVVAAANRPPDAPVQAETHPPGTGRLTVASASGEAIVLVDGTTRGPAPVTVDLAAGAHRVLLRSPKGSVERAVRIQEGESSEISEAIFPGWIALTTPIDLTISEGGQALKRDERGWAILPPGPHEVHLDNRALGVHDVRRVVVRPGDTTRLSFAPHTSTISLTTNELADVWIDGTAYGQAPLVDQPVSIGVHDVRVRSAAHERWLRVRATVQPVTVNVDLTAN